MEHTAGEQDLVARPVSRKSEALKRQWKEGKRRGDHFKGKRHTEEAKKKMSETKSRWHREVGMSPESRARSNAALVGRKILTGSANPAWKGGRLLGRRDGYVQLYVPNHPRAIKNGNGGGGYVFEHRLVMEKILGRELHPKETVHHINGIKDDNRPENLMLMRPNKHFHTNECPSCGFAFRVP